VSISEISARTTRVRVTSALAEEVPAASSSAEGWEQPATASEKILAASSRAGIRFGRKIITFLLSQSTGAPTAFSAARDCGLYRMRAAHSASAVF